MAIQKLLCPLAALNAGMLHIPLTLQAGGVAVSRVSFRACNETKALGGATEAGIVHVQVTAFLFPSEHPYPSSLTFTRSGPVSHHKQALPFPILLPASCLPHPSGKDGYGEGLAPNPKLLQKGGFSGHPIQQPYFRQQKSRGKQWGCSPSSLHHK